MSRSDLLAIVVRTGFFSLVFSVLASLFGCSSSSVHITSFPVPASIAINPAPNVSLELGTNQAFTVAIFDSAKGAITEPVSFQSSNTAVVTVAANGLACAGSWDSLSNPQICTPGPTGVAQVTAIAQGVSSPPTTIYVHQHIDKVVVNEIPPPPPLPPPPPGCSSVGQVRYYAANAFSRGADITPTVGIFTWQSLFTNVATLNTTAAVLLPGQVQVTAAVPGQTSIAASIGNANSVPIYFTTCAVQSIALTVTGSTATSKVITPTVVDSLGNTIPPGTFLSWTSSEPASATVSSSGGVTALATGGGATIVATCTPPTCNTGFYPSVPIYPQTAVTIAVPGTSTAGTVYVSSTGCGATDGCVSTTVPITTPANTVGTFLNLPATPNSLVFNRQGNTIYLGTDSGLLGSVGLAVVDVAASSVTQFATLPGKVLAVSPDGSKVIISDTSPADGPNQVFIFDTASRHSVSFRITGATAADFSPDSLKAYIVAGNTLYIYSKLDALKTVPLTASANDVSFLAEGAFAYLAGGDPAGVLVGRTCDNDVSHTVAVGAAPSVIKTLPGPSQLLPGDTAESFHMFTLTPPNVGLISVNAPSPWVGCSPTVIDNSPPPESFNLGLGNFVAKQLIVSQDGSVAYVVSNLNSIAVFNIAGQTSTALTLVGNAIPLNASLTPNGSVLYVGANDGQLHIVNTVVGGDIQQISFPQGLCRTSTGQPFPVACNPDLVAVRP